MATTYSPDGHGMESGSWGADADHATDQTYGGTSSIKFPSTGSGTAKVYGPLVSFSGYDPIQVSGFFLGSNAGTVAYLAAKWYTCAEVYDSTTVIYSGSPSTTSWQQVRQTVLVPLTGTGGYVRIVFGKDGGTNGNLWFGGWDIKPVPKGFRAYLDSDQTISSGAVTIVGAGAVGWTENYDFGACFDNATANAWRQSTSGSYTMTGRYGRVHFDASVEFEDLADGVTAVADFYKNGSWYAPIGRIRASGAGNLTFSGSCEANLDGNDYMDVRVYHDAGVDKVINAGSTTFSGHEIE